MIFDSKRKLSSLEYIQPIEKYSNMRIDKASNYKKQLLRCLVELCKVFK